MKLRTRWRIQCLRVRRWAGDSWWRKPLADIFEELPLVMLVIIVGAFVILPMLCITTAYVGVWLESL